MLRLASAFCLLLLSTAVLADEAEDLQRAKDERIVQTVLRLPGFDLNAAKPETKVEVQRVLDKVGEYLDAGVRMVWVIDPAKRHAAI